MPLAIFEKLSDDCLFRRQPLHHSCWFDQVRAYVTYFFLLCLFLQPVFFYEWMDGEMHRIVAMFNFVLVLRFVLVLYDVRIFVYLDVDCALIFLRSVFFLSRSARSSVLAIFPHWCFIILLLCSFGQQEGVLTRDSEPAITLWFESWLVDDIFSFFFIKRFGYIWPKEDISLVFCGTFDNF